MADLVETVARTVALEFNVDPDVFIGMHGRHRWEKQWHAIARAAIAAVLDDMAEPSAGMLEAGTYVIEDWSEIVDTRELASRVWQAMLAQYRKEMLGED